MSQSLAKIYIHAIFSTKNRASCLSPDIRHELFPYMATVLQNLDCPPIIVGGEKDHLHILCALSKNLSAKDFIAKIKPPTSKWLKTKGVRFGKFQWQNGYGVFSVSASNLYREKKYIMNQAEHHKKVSFQDEFREFLKRYEIEYDEEHVWD